MKIRIIAVLLLIAVSLFAFAACNDQQGDFVSQEKAQEAAVEAAGLSIS